MCKLGTTLSQELILNRQDVIDKTVQNWNRMQNAAECVWGGGGVFYQCEEYACRLYKFDYVRIVHKV